MQKKEEREREGADVGGMEGWLLLDRESKTIDKNRKSTF